jgi:hypothetical protein
MAPEGCDTGPVHHHARQQGRHPESAWVRTRYTAGTRPRELRSAAQLTVTGRAAVTFCANLKRTPSNAGWTLH